jgi:hypothetical protein
VRPITVVSDQHNGGGMGVARSQDRLRLARPRERRGTARLRRGLSGHDVVVCLIALAALSTALRIALVIKVNGPLVFLDELGYERLAESIGRSGQLALFGKQGLSYSPLYSVVLAPIYAVGVSAVTAYHWIKIVNAFLISLSIFPVYKIARFVLPRGHSLGVAAVSAFAPLMYYAAFAMSENLAYPLALVSVWAMLIAVRTPSARADAMLLAAIVAASLARLQLVVLLPAAVTAVILAASFARQRAGESFARSLGTALKRHPLLLGATVALVLLAGARSVAGHGLLSFAGRYANVGARGFPSPWRLIELAARHVAGLDLAVGVFPFVAALVAATAFFRFGSRRDHAPFAAVALSLTAWLLLETAFDAALFDVPPDLPRIHERYLIYVVPFFLVALFAAVRLPESKAPYRTYLAAAGVAGLLPLLIPYHTVVNVTNVVDSFGLQPFGRFLGGRYVPVAHATLSAVFVAITFAMAFVVVRSRLRAVIILTLVTFVSASSFVLNRIDTTAASAAMLVPAQRDWVDRAVPTGEVILVAGAGKQLPWHETAFSNLSISRVYSLCSSVFGPEFGEQRVTVGKGGRLRDPAGYLDARYAVVPVDLRVRGPVVARNTKGRQVLVAPTEGRLSVTPAQRADLGCGRPLTGA